MNPAPEFGDVPAARLRESCLRLLGADPSANDAELRIALWRRLAEADFFDPAARRAALALFNQDSPAFAVAELRRPAELAAVASFARRIDRLDRASAALLGDRLFAACTSRQALGWVTRIRQQALRPAPAGDGSSAAGRAYDLLVQYWLRPPGIAGRFLFEALQALSPDVRAQTLAAAKSFPPSFGAPLFGDPSKPEAVSKGAPFPSPRTLPSEPPVPAFMLPPSAPPPRPTLQSMTDEAIAASTRRARIYYFAAIGLVLLCFALGSLRNGGLFGKPKQPPAPAKLPPPSKPTPKPFAPQPGIDESLRLERAPDGKLRLKANDPATKKLSDKIEFRPVVPSKKGDPP